MKTLRLLTVVLLSVTTMACSATSSAPEAVPPEAAVPGAAAAEPDIDVEADRILRQMGKTLGGAQAFSFRVAAVYDEVLHTGLMVQYDQIMEFKVRRPNRFRVEYEGDEDRRLLVYDGKTVTLVERDLHLYGSAKAPATIDATVDMLVEQLGLTIPNCDFLFTDSYGVLIENAMAGSYLGTTRINGKEAHHLLFSQDGLDWQIWIETGARSLPLRMVLTYTDAEGAPRYGATFSGWNLNPTLTEADFTAAIPADAEQIDFQKSDEAEHQE